MVWPRLGSGGGSGAADDDVAVGGAGADPDGLLRAVGAVEGGERVPDRPGRALRVQPRRRPAAHPGVHVAVGGLEFQRTPDGLAYADLAVLGDRLDRGVRLVD